MYSKLVDFCEKTYAYCDKNGLIDEKYHWTFGAVDFCFTSGLITDTQYHSLVHLYCLSNFLNGGDSDD